MKVKNESIKTIAINAIQNQVGQTSKELVTARQELKKALATGSENLKNIEFSKLSNLIRHLYRHLKQFKDTSESIDQFDQAKKYMRDQMSQTNLIVEKHARPDPSNLIGYGCDGFTVTMIKKINYEDYPSLAVALVDQEGTPYVRIIKVSDLDL